MLVIYCLLFSYFTKKYAKNNQKMSNGGVRIGGEKIELISAG